MRHFSADPAIKGRLIVLENDIFDMIKYGYNISILGCTLWTCVRQNENAHDSASIIGNSKAEHNRRFQETFAWLKEEVQVIRKEDPKRRILIIMHYAPTLAKSSHPSQDDGKGPGWRGSQMTFSVERVFLVCRLVMFGFLDICIGDVSLHRTR